MRPPLLGRKRRGASRPVQGARIYLAARTARQAELQELARELAGAGAEVTSRWLSSAPLLGGELAVTGRAPELASMDLEDLSRADVCIAFTEPAEAPSGRGGRHTEFGIALALRKRVIIIGPREHVFHCLPEIEHFASWAEARQTLLPKAAATAPAALEQDDVVAA